MKDEIKEILDNTLEYLEGIDETRNTKILTTIETNILLDYITNLEEIRKEHNIMKQFIYENGLWEKFLNDDRFLEHLRSDDNA